MIESKKKTVEIEEFYRYLLEEFPVPVALLDSNGNIVYVNPATERFVGYTPEDLTGKNFVSPGLIPPEFTPIIHERFMKRVAGEEIKPLEVQVYKKNGDIAWISGQMSRLRMNGNDLIQIVIQDINHQKIMEKELSESEEIFKTITEQSFIGIAILQDDVIKYINNEYAHIVGYSIEEMMSWTTKEYLKVAHPDFIDIIAERAEKKQAGNTDVPSNYQVKALRKDGKEIWVEVFSKSINHEGRPADLITILDITDQNEAENKLVQAEVIIKDEIKKLKELDKFRKDFINHTSHELKTPLTAIYGAIQLLHDVHKESLNEEALELTEIALNESKKLKVLIQNLLDISRLESGKLELYKEKSDLVSLINRCTLEVKSLVRQRNQIIETDLPEIYYLKLDKLKFEQVISNILSNAIKYTSKEGKINIELKDNANTLEILIKDTGLGFTEFEMSNLFKKYRSFKREVEASDTLMEGSGLGLYYSKEIVEMHDGKIWAESEGRNKGSLFTIRLPKI